MKEPQGSPTPVLWQKLQWQFNSVGYMKKARQKYGDFFIAPVLESDSAVFVSHPEALEQILNQKRTEIEAPGNLNQIMTPYHGNYSIFVLDGDRHQRHRRLLMPAFHGARMRAYANLIGSITNKTIEQYEIHQTFSARSLMHDISMQIILQAVFGLHEGERCSQLKQLINSLFENVRAPFIAASFLLPFLRRDLGSWSPWGYFVRQREKIDEIIYQEIAKCRSQANVERTDILSMLVSARDEDGQPMSDVELRDELMTLLLAGHINTASTMTWALYWIHKNPEVLQHLLAELDTLGESPELTTIFRLPYLTAVCNESLRIYPVEILTKGRMVKSPIEVMGYHLSPGTAVYGCIYLLHHREDLYPEPQQFKPERFLEKQFSSYEFMPFGSGVRRCIGEALAQYEMKLVLANILSQYQLELADNREARPMPPGTTFPPAVKMLFRGKRHSANFLPNEVLLTSK